MEEKLIEKLAKIKETLSKETIGLVRLEQLRSETKKAFDAAIRRMISTIDYREELARHREQLRGWRVGFFRTIFPVNLRYLFSMPFIYGMLIPMAFFHICLEIYHQVCFRIYSIPLVRPSQYFVNDRQMLPYLNWFEKINCVYCSYYNNLIEYAGEIGGRTERYWCPIKHSKRVDRPHSQYKHFVDYLDAENFRTKAKQLRDFSDIAPKKPGAPEKCDFMK
ncbi:MAG: hypothetical protein WCG84_04880 [Candidatus Moraniibacteriota bacterium]